MKSMKNWTQQSLLLSSYVVFMGCGQDVSLTGTRGEAVVSPALKDLGTVAVDATETFTVEVSSVQGEVKVIAVDVFNVEGDYFSVDASALPSVDQDEIGVITFSYTPEEEGLHWAQVTVVTDEATDEEHDVVVRGQAVVGAVQIWPAVIDFGPVSVGETAEETFTVQNSGQASVIIDTLSFSEVVFSENESVPIEVEAGEEKEVSISFDPTDEDEVSADLVINFGSGLATESLVVRGNACSTGSGALYDQDGDGFSICSTDCDDEDAAVNPAAEEECDGIDNDCDDIIDEGTECYDDDGDGYSEQDGDCNDGDENASPSNSEVPENGIDDDCDGTVDDDETDLDGDGYAAEAGDCDDDDDEVYPGAPEEEDGIDNDCDSTVDEGTDAYDDDGDGYTEDDGDCDDGESATYPYAPEVADWMDNDCDGTVDEGTSYYDDDGDGYTEAGGDCDDDDDEINPGAYEAVDGIDNDCDGTTL